MEFLSKSIEETAQIAKDFASSLDGAHQGALVVGLYGDLGSGKTTFMKYLAESFGITEMIQSPTFVIMKIYKTSPQPLPLPRGGATRSEGGEVFKHLIHIDAYRIEKEEEMLNLGWQEIISDPKNLICVELPERIKGIMPPHIMLKFEHVEDTESTKGDGHSRKVSIA